MKRSDKLAPDSNPLAFLLGGGEMGRLIWSMDWSKTSLGPVAEWPQSLRTTLSICLASDLPICVIWGPGLVQLYNDAYRVICGDKHPQSMGQYFPECWKEVWPVIGKAHNSALAGDTAFLEAQQVFLERHGYVEECFFTFSFSPIRDEAGRVGGLFHPVNEITAQMLAQRREASEALRTSEQHHRLLFDQSVDGIFLADATGRYVDVNTAGCEMLGYSREEVLARMHSDMLEPDEWPRIGSEVAQLASGQMVRSEWRFRRKDGSEFVGEITGTQLPDGRLQAFLRDITERRAAEAATRASEARVSTILESITDGFFALDGDWRITSMNAAGERFLNRTSGDLIGKVMWDEFPGTVGSEFERFYRRVVASRVGGSITAHYPNFDRWYEITAYPAPDGLSVYFRDVTEQKHAAELLRASEERRRLALDAAELGTWFVDPATRVTKTDARYRAIFGTTEEWTDYLQAVAVIHPDDQSAVLEAVTAATRLEDPAPYAIEYRIVHPDGSLRWVFANGRASFEGVGPARRVVSFDGTVADITDRKRSEEERERLIVRLREQDQRKDEFLATLAHELRNPLAPIRNGLHIMRLAHGDPNKTEQTRLMMERQLGQMVHLIDDLLDLSRISRGKIDLRKERIELASAIAQAIETSRPLIAQANHELLIDVPPGPIYVDADLTRLIQVFSNLLINAAKFTERGGRVRLAVQLIGLDAVVSVADNGIGIPTHMLPQIFEMFTQVDGNLERSQGGLGIGLSIVQRLVQMHGGSVKARSGGPGKGSEFVVRLPVALSLAADNPAHDPDPFYTATRHRILVVDDNVDAANSLGQLLEMLGNEVLTCYDGASGIKAASTFQPGILLCDVAMPKMNGYDTARSIRAEEWGKNTVLVALTGYGHADDLKKSADAGFDHHLVKPLDVDVLLTLLAGLQSKPA